MNKGSVVLFGVMAAALGASVACNVILNGRVGRMEEQLRRTAGETCVKKPEAVPAPVPVPAAKSAPAEEKKSEKPKFHANLPETPILFKSAAWRDGEVVLDFESECGLASASFVVSPQVPVRGRLEGTKILLAGDFVPGMKYRVIVPAGMKNTRGGKLENDAVAEIKIPDKSPEVSFATSGTYLPLYGKKLVLPFRTVNCEKVKAVVQKAFENNLNPYVIGSYAGDARMIRVAEKTFEFKTPKTAKCSTSWISRR